MKALWRDYPRTLSAKESQSREMRKAEVERKERGLAPGSGGMKA